MDVVNEHEVLELLIEVCGTDAVGSEPDEISTVYLILTFVSAHL